MYKVVLVDDEALTREAIKKNIPWEETGFELIGTAENGLDALELIEKCPPDLILTDICMPVMDGLALSAHVQTHYPDIKIVVISGYDDFEYAKQAIRYEVSNYIMKPITSCELVEELKRMREKIESSLERTKEIEKVQKDFEDNIPALRNHFLNRLLEGAYNNRDIADIEEKLNRFNISLTGNYQTVVMLEVEEFAVFESETYENLIEFSVANITEELVSDCDNVVFFKNINNKSTLIFAENSEEKLMGKIKSTCESIMESIYECIKIRMYAIVGETVEDIRKLQDSYKSFEEAKENKFLFEDKKFVYGQAKPIVKTTRQDKFIHQIDHLVLAIKLGNMPEIEEEITDIFQDLRESGREKKQILVVIQNLALSIFITLENHISDKVKEYDKEEFVLQLSELKHFSDIEKIFLQFCKDLAEGIAGSRENENEKQAIRAVDYIEKNYMNVDISLNKVCEYLCVSTSYFSAIFKNSTGETFIETLTRVRIKKAKELLESTNMKNYEIALAVGYQDPHYFSSTFKKHVSLTPTEYAKKLQKGK